MNFLDIVTEEKRKYAAQAKKKRSLIKAIESAKKRGNNPVISEIKRKSPSQGKIMDVDIVETAKIMESAGACAISFLTDEKYFGGSISELPAVREAVSVPVLRKDFIVDEFQVYEAFVFGADAVLLMANILKENLPVFVELVHKLGMEALVEIHDTDDLKFALNSDARLLGVNNRNLEDLTIDLNNVRQLSKHIPEGKIVVSESGVNSQEDLNFVLKYADAALIGTGIMKSGDIGGIIREFVYGV